MPEAIPQWFIDARNAVIAQERAAEQEPAAPTVEADPTDQAEVVRAAAQAARTQAALVADARDYLRTDLPDRGYPAAMVDDLLDDEVLELAGLPVERQLTPQQQREAKVAAERDADPAAFAHKQDLSKLEERWWSLAKHQRQAECDRLGVNFAEASQNMLEAANTSNRYRVW